MFKGKMMINHQIWSFPLNFQTIPHQLRIPIKIAKNTLVLGNMFLGSKIKVPGKFDAEQFIHSVS